ncbi:hypothetical protein HZ326_28281 [Fusarium oxysporum f. sp. albedinis]|nr:hypothetical protein HZ326_28281 [Fusarium oxysporum f. sp. albedinis]
MGYRQRNCVRPPIHWDSVEAYQIKKKRCHRCQGYGHLAWSCKERARCGHCGGKHERRNCPPNTAPLCIDCNGPHPLGNKECPGGATHSGARAGPQLTHVTQFRECVGRRRTRKEVAEEGR